MASRTWEILSTKVVHSGTNANGAPYSIYEVVARDPATGIQVPLPLRSFDDLPVGVGTFDVVKYERPGKPTTYTLKKPGGGGGGGGGGAAMAALTTRVEMLEEALGILQNQMAGMRAAAQPVLPGGAPAPSNNFGGDDDIPF